MSLAMRSRAVRRPFLCWDSMAFAPPPWRICSSLFLISVKSSMMRRVFFWKSGESRLMEDFRVEADTPAPSQTEELSIRRLVPMKQNTVRRFERRGAEFAQKRKRKAVGPACGRQAAAGQKK